MTKCRDRASARLFLCYPVRMTKHRSRHLMRPALIAALLLALAIAPAAAQVEMHRTAAVADDGTGWHRAVSTKGAFSVRVPMPFNDVTTRVNDANVGEFATHTIGGTNPKGIKITASEMPITPRMKDPNLEGILASFGSQAKPGSV